MFPVPSALLGSASLLVAVAAWATFASACGTSSFTGSAKSDGGPENGSGPCWPSGSCGGNSICCVGGDQSAQCTSVSLCPSDHASLACLRPSDCDAGYCCVKFTELIDAGVSMSIARSACSPTDCATIAASYRICEGPADCASATSCQPEPKYIPQNIAICLP